VAVELIHPGGHLAEELKGLGMSAAELARNLNVPTNRITAILHGQRSITGDTALRLEHFFGKAPQFWLNLQSIYDLRLRQKGRIYSTNYEGVIQFLGYLSYDAECESCHGHKAIQKTRGRRKVRRSEETR